MKTFAFLYALVSQRGKAGQFEEDDTLLHVKANEAADEISQLHLAARALSIKDTLRNPDNDSHVDEPQEPPQKLAYCHNMFAEEVQKIIACMSESNLGKEALVDYYYDLHSVSEEQYGDMWLAIAQSEAYSNIKGECDPVHDMGLEWQDYAAIQYAGKKAMNHIVELVVEVLEDPRTDLYIDQNFGSDELAAIFNQQLQLFGEICETASTDMVEIKQSCLQHMNLDAFVNSFEHGHGITSCTESQASLLQEHSHRRHNRNHQKARLVQILSTNTNNLADHFHAHLRLGGSERHMEYLIAAAALGDLTPRQRHLLFQLDQSLPHTQLEDDCAGWSKQRDEYMHDAGLRDNVLLNSSDYRAYMDCLCHATEPRIVCQATFMRAAENLASDIKHRHLLTETKAGSRDSTTSEEQFHTQLHTGLEAYDQLVSNDQDQSNLTVFPVHLGPCLLSDAFSCNACLGPICTPLGRPTPKGRKNSDDDASPWFTVSSALDALEAADTITELSISCVACMSLHPGEQISFEVEMYVSTDISSLDDLFTSFTIGVDGMACIGPGSPLRVLFDSIGIPACQSHLQAEYMPFLGDFSIRGARPGIVTGTQFEADFGTRIHDPPGAVRQFCTKPVCGWQNVLTIERRWPPKFYMQTIWTCGPASFDPDCYAQYRDLAGPMLFEGATTVPLYATDQKFEIVKVSGPHPSAPLWRVELFEMPFDQVVKPIIDLWNSHIAPSMEKALNGPGGNAVTAAGDWTVGAANDAGQWTVNTATHVGHTVGNAAVTAGNAVGNAAVTTGNAVGNAAVTTGNAIGNTATSGWRAIGGLFR